MKSADLPRVAYLSHSDLGNASLSSSKTGCNARCTALAHTERVGYAQTTLCQLITFVVHRAALGIRYSFSTKI
jgi:hypothetical protein